MQVNEEEYSRLRLQAELSTRRAPKAARVMATAIVVMAAAALAAILSLAIVKPADAAEGDMAVCHAGAARMLTAMKQEAKGTRHEAQIKAQIEKVGGEGAMIKKIARSFNQDACLFLWLAPDPTIHSLAIAALPERLGD